MAVNVHKVTIAIGKAEYAWARKRAKREGRSVSAVLTAATREVAEAEAKRERQQQAWAELQEWMLGGKPPTAVELEAARRELDGER